MISEKEEKKTEKVSKKQSSKLQKFDDTGVHQISSLFLGGGKGMSDIKQQFQ